MKILIHFDRYCREHHIQYFLGGGTLLGAVRHQGFIPWDDDIDVMMTGENYKKLQKHLLRNNTDERFFFQTPQTGKSYHDHMIKLRLKHTIFATTTNLKFPEMEKGFFIDIFSHNKTSENVKVHKLHVFLTKLARSMVYHKWMGTPMQYYGKHVTICRFVTMLISVLPISLLERFRDCIITWFDHTNSHVLYDGYGEHLEHGFFDEEILQESRQALFEKHLFPVPVRYDEYLRFSYGDHYMELPPEDERIPHHDIAQIDFGDVNLDEFNKTV